METVRRRADDGAYRRQHAEGAYENRTFDERERRRATAAERMRVQRTQADQANRQWDRTNPYSYVRSGIGAMGAGGAAAERRNDLIRSLGARFQLGRMERNKRRRMVSASRAEAAQLRQTLESIAEARESMAGGRLLSGLEGNDGSSPRARGTPG